MEEMVGRAFVDHYYHLFDHDRSALSSLYQPESMLTFEGQKINGVIGISAKLNELPFDQCRHAISTVDAQPSTFVGGIMVFVSGSLQLHGEDHSLRFSQVDHITPLLSFLFVKEREMEIGCPTDVKHVAHIGWDGPSGNAPSWMNEFRTGPDFAATSIGNCGSALSPWSSQDFGESMRQQLGPEMSKDTPGSENPSVKKKHRRKKSRSTNSPKSNSSSTSRSSRAAKSKAKLVEGNAKPTNIEVA
ncbi:hypothetical protein RD792_002731 [Penstemon davidsonii]|uniref:Uncharacterized protein n=1 Tax=Penstemon davidsonii TaxID=160366 RepID=A0ABR0DST8_9LAMI|nr:hypothetical protein RD792_002731 [Penstemon davidsonii]